MKIFLFILVSSCAVLSSCKDSKPLLKRYSFLTWEYHRDGPGDYPGINAQVLVKYTFGDTGFIRTEIFRTEHYVPHYSDAETKVYDDRYLINSFGDIYDLESNKIIFDHIGSDKLVDKRGDSVIMHHIAYDATLRLSVDSARFDSIKSEYYFFDLRSKKIEELPELGPYKSYSTHQAKLFGNYQTVNGVISPDHRKIAYFKPKSDTLDISYVVDSATAACAWTRIFPTWGHIYIRSETKEIQLPDSVRFNFGIWISNSLPIYWINDNELLTHRNNGEVIRITLKPYSIVKFKPLPSVEYCGFQPYFSKTAANDIFYFCQTHSKNLFAVDLDKNSLTAFDSSAIGFNYMTKEGLKVELQKEPTPTHRQYDYWGWLKVYDPEQKKSYTIKSPFIKQLIGWVKEK